MLKVLRGDEPCKASTVTTGGEGDYWTLAPRSASCRAGSKATLARRVLFFSNEAGGGDHRNRGGSVRRQATPRLRSASGDPTDNRSRKSETPGTIETGHSAALRWINCTFEAIAQSALAADDEAHCAVQGRMMNESSRIDVSARSA